METEPNHDTARLVLVTGLSGAGKSTALHTFADHGFYVIENLPPQLMPELKKLFHERPTEYRQVALLPDIDSAEAAAHFLTLLPEIEEQFTVSVIFLDATTQAIIRRYSETRRPHPGFNPDSDSNLEDAIEREHGALALFKGRANLYLDTTACTIHDLRRRIEEYIALTTNNPKKVRVSFVSFGFKYGAPMDCDLLVDVRFLPNPHFDPKLRRKTGLDPEVQQFVLEAPDAREFLNQYSNLLQFLLPRYVFEGKSYLTIGVGCTGGHHRSVTLAEKLATGIDTEKYVVSVSHRDIEK